MSYFALPEEQIDMLLGAHRRRPLQIVVMIPRQRPVYQEIDVTREALLEAFRNRWITSRFTMALFLRDASLPGDLCWISDGETKLGPALDEYRSNATVLSPSQRIGGELLEGGLWREIPREYREQGGDPRRVRSIREFMSRRLQRLCQRQVMIPEATLNQVELPAAVADELAQHGLPASEGAVRFYEEGGILKTRSIGVPAECVPLSPRE